MRPIKGAELEVHYVETLRELGLQKGMLGGAGGFFLAACDRRLDTSGW